MDNYLMFDGRRINGKELTNSRELDIVINDRIHSKMLELLEEVEETNQGEVIFSDRAKTVIEEIANLAENTFIFHHSAHRREIFEKNIGETTPSIMYGYILNRIMEEPTEEYVISNVILLVPILNKLLKGEK